ncbi:DUF4239 domain-containing protein [Candidatus Falkowbacteria bacterium]|nr:DUF4239 domain-containing protein [Candidatus Falkowbacteria bacterium]
MKKTKQRFRLRFKIIIFLVAYSITFYGYRTSSYYNYRSLISNIDSIPWLYSTIGLIFGMLSTFIIQKEWQQWNDLVDSAKGENSALYEMWLWSKQLKREKTIEPLIKKYLQTIIAEGWQKTEAGEISHELDLATEAMYTEVSNIIKDHPHLASPSHTLMGNIMSNRERRIRFGSSHMPPILLQTLRFSTALMVFLCPLIAVKTLELHYLFSASIAVLSYTIYIVVLDMNQPLKPGGWHLTTSDYQKLLYKLEAEKN